MARDARRSDVETTRRGIYSRRLPGGPVENDGEVGFKTRSLKTRNLRRAAADKKDLPRIPRRRNADGAWWLCGEICQCEIQEQIKPKN